MPIELKECASSSMKAHGYDPATKTLAVQFNGGKVYHYEGVDENTYTSMCCADSLGKYFAQNIRHRFTGVLQPDDKKE